MIHTILTVFYTHLLIVVIMMIMRKLRQWNNIFPKKLPLPPGSMGWPFFGETFQFYSSHPNAFFTSRIQSYGEVFKSHILGYPCAMLASPAAARFVLITHSHLFKPAYPRSKEQLIGPAALFFHQGPYHAHLRKLVRSSLTPLALRSLTTAIESTAASTLLSWNSSTLPCFPVMKNFSFDVGILAVFGGPLPQDQRDELIKNYLVLDKGYNSFPSSLPGTPYSKAVKARNKLGEILAKAVKERRGRPENTGLIGYLMKEKGGVLLSDEQISDNIIGVLFAAQDTTASAITWAVKYLHDNPKILEAVKAEHTAAHELNGRGSRPLEWSQTKGMLLTQKVILESLRLASIISFTFREAVADVEYNGYLIPKGWKVMPLFRNIHHNPDFFPDPHSFDPSRFNSSPKPNTFMPFGNGVHACPGNELAKLQMVVFVHHLITKYRFEVVGPSNDVDFCPFPVPKHGLPVRVYAVADGDCSASV